MVRYHHMSHLTKSRVHASQFGPGQRQARRLVCVPGSAHVERARTELVALEARQVVQRLVIGEAVYIADPSTDRRLTASSAPSCSTTLVVTWRQGRGQERDVLLVKVLVHGEYLRVFIRLDVVPGCRVLLRPDD